MKDESDFDDEVAEGDDADADADADADSMMDPSTFPYECGTE
jgi:hypothetical protein